MVLVHTVERPNLYIVREIPAEEQQTVQEPIVIFDSDGVRQISEIGLNEVAENESKFSVNYGVVTDLVAEELGKPQLNFAALKICRETLRTWRAKKKEYPSDANRQRRRGLIYHTEIARPNPRLLF